MSRLGRPPKPTQLKVIEGNRGKRALPANEPKPEISIPSCPSHLDKVAKAEWRRISRELAKLQLLTQVDRSALASYCQAWSRWADAEEKIQKDGAVIPGSMGSLVQSPWVRIAFEAMRFIRAFSQEFGLTPAARSRISVPNKQSKSLGEIAAARADAVRSKQG